MTRLVRLTAAFALLAPLVLVAGCKQKAGDRCQVQSDCEDGLLCVLQANATPAAGGTCQSPGGATDMATTTAVDMANMLDLTGVQPADLSSTD